MIFDFAFTDIYKTLKDRIRRITLGTNRNWTNFTFSFSYSFLKKNWSSWFTSFLYFSFVLDIKMIDAISRFRYGFISFSTSSFNKRQFISFKNSNISLSESDLRHLWLLLIECTELIIFLLLFCSCHSNFIIC
jgi:hypothetical protein